MTGTERKRKWRVNNPERSAAYERERAQRRRNEHFDLAYYGGHLPQNVEAADLRVNSYHRYENRRKAKRIEAWDPLWAAYLRGEITWQESTTDEMRTLFRALVDTSAASLRGMMRCSK